MEPSRKRRGDPLGAADWNAAIERLLADRDMPNGFAAPDAVGFGSQQRDSYDFRGQAAEAIPAFSVFGISGAVSTGSPPKVTVAKFTASDDANPPVLITNGQQAIGAANDEVPCWLVTDDRPMLLATDATNPPTAGNACGVKLGTYTVASTGEGLLALTGAFSGPRGVNVAWCLRAHGIGGEGWLLKTPVGGIPAKSGTTWGSATCDVYYLDDNGDEQPDPGGQQVTCYHGHPDDAIAGEIFIHAKTVRGKLLADVEYC